jgi:hypothetical protein
MEPAKLIFAVTVFAPLLCAQSGGSISGLIANGITGAGIEGAKVGATCLAGGSTRCPGDGAQPLPIPWAHSASRRCPMAGPTLPQLERTAQPVNGR